MSPWPFTKKPSYGGNQAIQKSLDDDPAGHTGDEDYEPHVFLLPRVAQVVKRIQTASIVDILSYYDVPYVEEPGWLNREDGYDWYEGGPFGVMMHHTVSDPYDPRSCYPAPEGRRTDGRVICNVLVARDGTLHFIAAGPANYSSGENDPDLLNEYVLKRERFYGPQQGAYVGGWYGNRAWINVEVSHPGDGSPLHPEQERAIIAFCAAACYAFEWDSTAVVGHCDGRGTKIDPRFDGEFMDPPYSMTGIQDKVNEILTNGLPPTGEQPEEDDEMWNEWVRGMVAGWAEDQGKARAEFTRLNTVPRQSGGYVLEPANTPSTVDYWVGKLADVDSPEWPGFVARTWLASWS